MNDNIENIYKYDYNFLKIDKKSYKNIGIYNIGYINLKIDDYESIYSENSLHLNVNHANRYIEEKNGNKYLVFDSTDENKDLLKKYANVRYGIKNKIEEISVGKCGYEKDFNEN